MKSRLVVVAGLLLSPSLFIGQQAVNSGFGTAGRMESSPQTGNQPATVFITGPAQACPVGLQAKQGGTGDLVKVRHAPEAQPETQARPGQRIHLIVTNPTGGASALKIVGATVTARGLSARGRVDKASGSGSGDVRRTLNVIFTGAPDSGLSAELNLPGFTAVKSIKIEALEYSDGSTRDLAGRGFCTVAPDPLMLVAGR